MSEGRPLPGHLKPQELVALLRRGLPHVTHFTFTEEMSRQLPEMLPDIMKRLNPAFPRPGETVGVSYFKPKTSALFFDRVWGGYTKWDVPSPVRVGGILLVDYLIAASLEYETRRGREFLEQGGLTIESPIIRTGADDEYVAHHDSWARVNADAMQSALGVQAVPVYSGRTVRDAEYTPGNVPMALASVANVALPDEERLEWSQILEFRRDAVARKDYRRFIHFLDGSMVGKSQDFIEDDIAIRLESYEEALKKHGIATAIGELQGLVDPGFLVGSSATAGMVALLSSPLWGLLAEGTLLIGNVSLKLAKYLTGLQEIRRSHSDVAWVYEAKKRFGADEA